MISVIVPVYKVEKYLRRCLDSLAAQMLEDMEIIIVDDGSPDGCPDICDEYAAKDARMKVVHKENGGLLSARKAGFAASKGDYIGFVDGDDWVEPDTFLNLYKAVASIRPIWCSATSSAITEIAPNRAASALRKVSTVANALKKRYFRECFLMDGSTASVSIRTAGASLLEES